MNRTETRGQLELRRLPTAARKAAAEKAAERRTSEFARSQFSRTFADVLSGRFGGRWSVEWKRPGDPSATRRRIDGPP
jgi:hypothetical protein